MAVRIRLGANFDKPASSVPSLYYRQRTTIIDPMATTTAGCLARALARTLVPRHEGDLRYNTPGASPCGVAGCAVRQGADMQTTEIQARATIAAALIMSRAVDLPTIPTSGDWSHDSAALRLRELTDYVYQVIATPRSR